MLLGLIAKPLTSGTLFGMLFFDLVLVVALLSYFVLRVPTVSVLRSFLSFPSL